MNIKNSNKKTAIIRLTIIIENKVMKIPVQEYKRYYNRKVYSPHMELKKIHSHSLITGIRE